MLRTLTVLLLSAAFACLSAVALPGTVFAQGAGDDQYADPFGDMPEDSQGDTDADTGGGGTDNGSTPTPTDSGEVAPETSGTPVAAEETSGEVAATASGEELPRTGQPADSLALIGLALLACGILIHILLLRFAPHSAYAQALRMGPLHQAPRPPGFEPLGTSRRVRRSRRT